MTGWPLSAPALKSNGQVAKDEPCACKTSPSSSRWCSRCLLLFIGFLLIDPFMLERAKALPPEARNVFQTITNVGRSNWMLIPTGRGGRARARAPPHASWASAMPPATA